MFRTKSIAKGIVEALSSDEEHHLARAYEVEVVVGLVACLGRLHGDGVFDRVMQVNFEF